MRIFTFPAGSTLATDPEASGGRDYIDVHKIEVPDLYHAAMRVKDRRPPHPLDADEIYHVWSLAHHLLDRLCEIEQARETFGIYGEGFENDGPAPDYA
jgi:hypothetical protein|tara:strand:+ start:407 stop:700 length:294 start_codon:yes stop_codon:yes gene_type:complete